MMDEARIKELSKKWAARMRAGEGDVAGELWCLTLEHPGAKILQKGEEGALFLEIRKRVGGCQISVGGTGGNGEGEEINIEDVKDTDEDSNPLRVLESREQAEEKREMMEPFRFMLGVLEDIDDAANGTVMSKIFGVSDRQGRNIRADFRRGLVAEMAPQIIAAAASRGIDHDRLVGTAQDFARWAAKRGQKAEAGDFKTLAKVLTASRLAETPAPRKAPAGSQLALA